MLPLRGLAAQLKALTFPSRETEETTRRRSMSVIKPLTLPAPEGQETPRPRSISVGQVALPLLSPVTGSETARNELIPALMAGDLKKQLENPDFGKTLVTLELAVYLAAILQMPYLADNRESVLSCIFELAARFVTMEGCPRERWNELTALLQTAPNTQALAAFLQKSDPEREAVDDKFVYNTWSQLSHYFNLPNPLEELEFTEEELKCVLSRWLAVESRSSTINFTLLMVRYTLSTERPDSWSFDDLANNSHFQHFVVQTITLVDDAEKRLRLLKKFTSCFSTEQKEWALLTDFDEGTLAHIRSIKLPAAACLAVVENQKITFATKHKVLCTFIDSEKELDIVVLGRLMEKLVLQQADDNLVDDIVARILKKPWNSTLIEFTLHYDKLYNRHQAQARKFLANLCTLYLDKLARDQLKTFDALAVRYIEALIENLLIFSVLNKMELGKMTPTSQQICINASIEVKAAALSLLFFLYGHLQQKDTKNKIYDQLVDKLSHLTVTNDPREFTMFEEDTFFGFTYGNITCRIYKP